MKFLDQPTLDDIQTALRNGSELQDIADVHGIDASYLRQLLDLPLSERERLTQDVLALHRLCVPAPTIAARVGLSLRETRHVIETGNLPPKQRQLNWA